MRATVRKNRRCHGHLDTDRFRLRRPDELATFWATALDYIVQPPPAGFDSWEEFLTSIGVPAESMGSKSAVVDPAGVGPRIFFQRVPETKVVKNRVHLDLNAGVGAKSADDRRQLVMDKVDKLRAAGATILREVEELGEHWAVMQDPEGNEFCVQ